VFAHRRVPGVVRAEPSVARTFSRSSTTSMVADSLWGSTPMNTLAVSFAFPSDSVVIAGRALLLRAGQTPLEPHAGTVTGGNTTRR
jgi:hypothetical protein